MNLHIFVCWTSLHLAVTLLPQKRRKLKHYLIIFIYFSWRRRPQLKTVSILKLKRLQTVICSSEGFICCRPQQREEGEWMDLPLPDCSCCCWVMTSVCFCSKRNKQFNLCWALVFISVSPASSRAANTTNAGLGAESCGSLTRWSFLGCLCVPEWLQPEGLQGNEADSKEVEEKKLISDVKF